MKAGLVGRWARVAVACAAVGFGLSATAGSVHYVRPGGTGAGGADDPFGTIAAAVGVAQAGDEIRVAGGVYQEAVVLDANEVTLTGGWADDFSVRDLAHVRSIIKAPSASGTCLTLNGIHCVVSGFDITGGSTGVSSPKGDYRADGIPASVGTAADWHNSVRQCVISNCTTGVSLAGKNGFVLASSLVCRNSGNAVTASADTGCNHYIHNCTIADNVGSALRRTHQYNSSYTVRNCIFLRNGSAFSSAKTFSRANYLWDNAYFGNGANFLYEPTTTSGYPGGTIGQGGTWQFDGRQLFVDPQLGTDYRLTAASALNGTGADLSSATGEAVTEDLYGATWDGAYDFGCLKGGYAPLAKHDEVYVATDGDDANAGTDAAAPKRTINAALAVLNEGGTCHVAAGVYTESVSVCAPCVTLVGAGRAKTVIEASAAPSAGVVAYNDTRLDFAVLLCATNVTVNGFTLRNANSGVMGQSVKRVKDSRIEDCDIVDNQAGVTVPWRDYWKNNWLVVSHSRVMRNGKIGIRTYGSLRLDNLLIADNGGYGILDDSWDQDSPSYYANLTITGNATYGYYNNGRDSSSVTMDNCIFEGNATCGALGRSTIKIRSSVFHDNGVDLGTNTNRSQTPDATTDCLFGEDPKLDALSATRGHLLEGSPCSQRGRTDYSGMTVPVTDDLDHMTRPEGKMDIGCYISPETMKDLAGDGYHIITVVGDPDGYGAPTPGYGQTLLRDGAKTFDFSDILTTDAFDGRRVVGVDDGVRALYLGYALTDDATGATLRSSDTEESFTVGFDRNCTLTLKWELQYRTVATTDSNGCTVQVADRPAGASCTAWVSAGEEYAIRFTDSDDFAFDAWTGDFPASGDPRVASTTAVSDRPHVITVATRPLLYVATTGSDDTGDGTRANPVATIGAAIGLARAKSVIYVAEGTYVESVVNTTVNELTFMGGYGPGWTRDLRNHPTTVEAPSASVDCFQITGVCSNTVNGFICAGGKRGVYVNGPTTCPGTDTAADRAARVHNLEQLVVTNCATGISNGGNGYCGYRIVSCLVVGNAGDGIVWSSDNKAYGFIHNCTVVGNGGNGITLGYGYSRIDVRNTVSADNGGKYAIWFIDDGHKGYGSYNNDYLSGMCLSGGTDAVMPLDPVRDQDSWVKLRHGIYLLDPALGEGYKPGPDSPCFRTGDNLYAYPLRAELYDLYGTPWNGEYDIGCVKGDAAPRAKAAELYVAPDGDDANDGLTAERPKRSIQKAVLALGENGTVRLAAGTYEETVCLSVKGMTLAGAGAGKTVVRGVTYPNGVVAPFNVYVAADDVTVKGLTSTGGHSGVRLPHSEVGKRALVADCEFSGNTNGVFASPAPIINNSQRPDNYYYLPDAIDETQPNHRISHCLIADNAKDGIRSPDLGAANYFVDNCLIVRNAARGVMLDDAKLMTSKLFYCTVADNGVAGICNGTENDGPTLRFVNGVLTRNAIGAERCGYASLSLENSVFSENETPYVRHVTSGGLDGTSGCSEEPARLDAKYRIGVDSPACGLGRALTASDPIAEPTDDLWHLKRSARRHDAGCSAYAPGFLLLVR